MRFLVLILTCFTLALQTQSLWGQEFLTPFEEVFPPSVSAYVINSKGDKTEGSLVFGFGSGRGIKKVTLVTDAGDRMEFRADDIRELGFKNNGMVKMVSVFNGAESLKKIQKTDWKQVFNREYIIFNSALLPRGKHVMMQTLNPGFDQKIRVFHSLGSRTTSGIGVPIGPGAILGPLNKGSLRLTGGLPRAYWVSKNGSPVLKLKKGNYNKRKFQRLFGDCPQMLESFTRPFRLKNFPLHVFFYDQQCDN